jgi:Uncharacterized protein conserved in bacteria
MRKLLFPLGCVVALAACETTRQGGSTTVRSLDESTMFLGANGRVVTVPSSRAKAREAERTAYWRGDGVSGSPSITVNLSEQKAYFYKGGQLVGETPISSGNAQNPTPRGVFKVIQRNKNHRSNLYGDYVNDAGYPVVQNVDVTRDPRPPGTKFQGAPMPYFLRIHGGVGLHAGYLPGFPDSHGCIRLPDHMAEAFFENAPLGTPVRVVN